MDEALSGAACQRPRFDRRTPARSLRGNAGSAEGARPYAVAISLAASTVELAINGFAPEIPRSVASSIICLM